MSEPKNFFQKKYNLGYSLAPTPTKEKLKVFTNLGSWTQTGSAETESKLTNI